jgi:hypothetical protein
MKKKDKVNEIFEELIQYGREEMKLPYIDKIIELKKAYDISNIVGLIEHFLKEHYQNKTIEIYFDDELKKYNQICPLFSFNLVTVTLEQKQWICSKIYELCEIIFK